VPPNLRWSKIPARAGTIAPLPQALGLRPPVHQLGGFAQLRFVRSMNAVSVYRTLLLVRGGWLALKWFAHLSHWSRWTHPYEPLVAALLSAGLVIVLTGLWLFRSWARWTFIVLLIPAVAYGATQRDQPLIQPTTLFIVVLSGAIIAMSFLPPVRDMFAKQRPNQALQPTAGRSEV